MFADHKDSLRNDYGIRNNEIERSLIKNHPNLYIPMPAIGEVFCKIRDKCKGRTDEVLLEMNRLFSMGLISPAYIHDSENLFSLANTIAKKTKDDRDQISTMDALIIAAATMDHNCSVLYTTDSQLIFDAGIGNEIDDWRDNKRFNPLAIRGVSEILKSK